MLHTSRLWTHSEEFLMLASNAKSESERLTSLSLAHAWARAALLMESVGLDADVELMKQPPHKSSQAA